MATYYHSKLIAQHASLPARVMRITTPHGEVATPTFMPVGTRAMLNYATPTDLQANGSRLILGGNTYHMLCTPGMEVLEKIGGMHAFMAWPQAMLTDSGGFQVLVSQKKAVFAWLMKKGLTLNIRSRAKFYI